MKKRPMKSDGQPRRRSQLWWKKLSLYLALAVSTVTIFVTALILFGSDYESNLKPQITRVIMQVDQLLPQLKQNEDALRDAYEQTVGSWDEKLDLDEAARAELEGIDASVDELFDDTLSWLNHITRLRFGRDGLVMVVSKESQRIVAHPDDKMIGFSYFGPMDATIDDASVVSSDSIGALTLQSDVNLALSPFFPKWTLDRVFASPVQYMQFMQRSMYGGILEYGDYYIVCGVPILKYLETVVTNSLFVSFIFAVQMWLLVRWACMVMDIRREDSRGMRNKLVSYTALLCLLFFVIISYYLTLSNVANDLKTIAKDVDAAAETLDASEDQRSQLEGFLDRLYTLRCSITEAMVSAEGPENLSREDMQHFADTLNVKYVYLFDQNGKAAVTNAPYDHLQVSNDPEHYTFQLRKVMDGVRSLVLPPMQDEWLDEYLQYVAVSRRDQSNLADGFVLIGVDPSLRDRLLKAFQVGTVLDSMVIGLPENAFAVDRETLEIVASNRLGSKGQSIEDLGITEDMLNGDFRGILRFDGTDYYVGVSTSSEYYLLATARHTINSADILIPIKLTLFALASYAVLILLVLRRYRQVVIDSAPSEEVLAAEPEAEVSPTRRNAWATAVSYMQAGLSSIRFSRQAKKGFEDRWHMHDYSKDQLSPEQRCAEIIYKLLLVFCLVILLPTFFSSLDGSIDPNNLNILAYSIAGNWQKGFNIFALTSCLYQLCTMFVIVVLLNHILYNIAKVSTMRVETVCLLIKNAAKYVCAIIFIYYGLAQFGVDTQTLLASAGILSLMISFGAKDLVSDIIAGFFTIFEGTYKVGDYITVGDWYGLVVEIGLRTTKVTYHGETKIFNNSSVRDIINCDEPARKTLATPVPYDADLEEIEAILAEELPLMMGKIPGLVKPPQYEGVASLGESSVNLCIAIYVDYGKRQKAMRSLAREIKVMFDRRGIQIPYNQLVLHNGDLVDDGKGEATDSRESDDGQDESVQTA